MILYAVVWRAELAALVEDGLRAVTDGDLAIVAGPAPASTSREGALDFGRTVERLAAAADVLPFRYGTSAADADEVRAFLRENASSWAARLRQVEGCAELAIRAAPPEGQEQPADSGRAHLGRLVGRSRQIDAAEHEVTALLSGRCRVVRRLTGHEELRLSCLVERPQIELVRLVVEDWASAQSDLDVSVTGPWAPYSFVSSGEEAV